MTNNGNITNTEARRPHLVCEVICLECYHRWIAVFPEDVPLKNLECSACGMVGYVIKTGQEVMQNRQEDDLK